MGRARGAATRCTAWRARPFELVPDGDDAAVLRGPALPRRPAPARRPVRGRERSAAGDLRGVRHRGDGCPAGAHRRRHLPEVTDDAGPPSCTSWSPDLVADHIGVTEPARTRRGDAVADPQEQAVPDALVGLAWPAVFACIGPVEGLLDLVHLDHRITWSARCPTDETELQHLRHPRRRRGHHGRPGDQRRGPHLAPATADSSRRSSSASWCAAAPAPPSWPPRPRWPRTPRRPAARPARPVHRDRAAPHGRVRRGQRRPQPAAHRRAAARLAGFDGPIVHGMWLSAVAQRAAASVGATHHPRPIRSWLTRWVAPLQPGAEVEITVERTGVARWRHRRRGQLPRRRRAGDGRRGRRGGPAHGVRLPGPGHPEPGHGPRGPLPLRRRPQGLGPRRPAHPRGARLLDPGRRPRQPDRPVGRR